jgi:predicted SprT family Zn-dependent metalloprotease
MDLFDAEILAKELISRVMPDYQFAWNNLKTINGQCDYRNKTIYLSRHLTPLREPENVQLTIMHELAHALHPNDGHGRLWQNQMRVWGLPTGRRSGDVVDKATISNWFATCSGCGKVSMMVRKPRVERSCGHCSNGKFNKNFLLTFTKR